MSFARKFTEHPATVGESCGEHFVSAMSFSLVMLREMIHRSIVSILHA